MINNRQNGRRRGRGGGAPRPNGGGADRGNRIDNRARGNAAQLHEKYKALARDAQMQGDRVMAEYYFQFADHYFRVLSESRARFDDQQQQRPRRDEWSQHGDDQDDFEDEGDGAGSRDDRAEPRLESAGEDRDSRDDRGGNQRNGREQRGNSRFDERRPRAHDQFAGRAPRFEEQQAPGLAADAVPAATAEEPAGIEEAPRRRGRRGPAAVEMAAPADDRLPADLLPPSFAAELPLGVEEASGEEPKPRRRGRKPKSADSVAVEI